MESELDFMEAVQKERERQRVRWGNTHDDEHSQLDWTGILCCETGEFGKALTPDDMKTELVQVAATALAAYQAIRRGGRASGW